MQARLHDTAFCYFHQQWWEQPMRHQTGDLAIFYIFETYVEVFDGFSGRDFNGC